MDINELYQIYLEHPSVQTDTRKVQQGDIYFALKGPNFNGNLFADQALQKGASFCVVDEEISIADKRVIRVGDVLTTLQMLAKKHREQFDIPFIAITGSNGKTTTKELIHAVLSTKYKTYTTEGNLNNHIGVPLTILKIKKDAEIAVIEMGANHQQEIASYCVYTLPSHGLITNCGKAHLEGFGGIEGVRKGKGELYQYLKGHHGSIFLFNDLDYLKEMSRGIDNIITYGTGIDAADIEGVVLDDKEYLKVKINRGASIDSIHTQLIGGYNLPNVLAAICVGKNFQVSDENIKNALESYTASNSRSQLLQSGSNAIILDAYNANPSSMKVAIENFANMPGFNKILMLGGMMELGEESKEEHVNLVKLIKQYNWEKVVLVGNQYQEIHEDYIYFPTVIEAREWFREMNFEKKQLLIKGSRSIQMEKILE